MSDIYQQTDSANLHIEDTGGDGRPVILIHGWPLSGKSWSEQIDVFSEAGYRVITYDRRGFGESEKPASGYDYDTFADDLAEVIESTGATDATLVGFSMGGGEVARYISRYGEDKIRSVVMAAAVPPYLMKTEDNPEGPLDEEAANDMRDSLEEDGNAFYDGFVTDFFSVNGELVVSEEQRQDALDMCFQADKTAALGAMSAFATTDFREDLPNVTVPTLIIHGDSDITVPFEGSGKRTHEAINGSELHIIKDGPHGINVSHTDEFNQALLEFFEK